MNTRAQILRNTAFASVGIYSEYFLGMLAAIMTARHLGPTHYGLYSLGIWFSAIGIVFTNSGVTTGVIKFVAELRGAQQEDLIGAFLGYMRRIQRLHLIGVLGIGALLFAATGERFTRGLDYPALAMLAVAVSLRAPYMFNIAVCKGFEAFGSTAKIALVAAPLNLAMVLLAVLLDAPIEWFLAVYMVSGAIFYLVSRNEVVKLPGTRAATTALPPPLLQRVRRHLRIVSVSVVVSYVMFSEVEVLFLNLYSDAAAAGYFKVAYQLANGVTLLLPGVFGAVLLPLMANALSQGQAIGGRRFAAATTYLLMLAAPLTAFGVTFAQSVIGLLYGSAYAAAVPAFAVCLFACAIQTVAQGASSLLLSADRQHITLIFTIVFGTLKFALDMVLISRFGLHGALAAIAIQSTLSVAAYMVVAMRVSGVSLHWARLSRIVVAAGIAALAAMPIRELHWPALPTLLLGGIVFAIGYPLLTLVLRCWTGADIEQLQGLHRRFAAGRPALLGRLLDWAGLRAQRYPS